MFRGRFPARHWQFVRGPRDGYQIDRFRPIVFALRCHSNSSDPKFSWSRSVIDQAMPSECTALVPPVGRGPRGPGPSPPSASSRVFINCTLCRKGLFDLPFDFFALLVAFSVLSRDLLDFPVLSCDLPVLLMSIMSVSGAVIPHRNWSCGIKLGRMSEKNVRNFRFHWLA